MKLNRYDELYDIEVSYDPNPPGKLCSHDSGDFTVTLIPLVEGRGSSIEGPSCRSFDEALRGAYDAIDAMRDIKR